jgi:hypothetical protein
MRFFGLIIIPFFILLVSVFAMQPQAQYSTLNYRANGGVWGIGGDLDVIDGGRLRIKSGAVLDCTPMPRFAGFIFEPTKQVVSGIGGTSYQMTWPGLEPDDAIIATLNEPVTATINAARANTGYATVYFSAAIQYATFSALRLGD